MSASQLRSIAIATGVLALLVCGVRSATRPAQAGVDPAMAAAAAAIPSGPEGDLIREGRQLMNQTRAFAGPYVTAGMECSACHINAGTVPHGGSLLGVYAKFPQWNGRAKRFITLGDRLDECFMYSMNGRPPSPSGREIVALTAYIAFLSRGADIPAGFPDQGFVTVKAHDPPDSAAGATVYAAQCEACHGANGAGNADGSIPPLWGPASFNDGAGMNTKMAAFVKANMPLGRGGSLSDQQATDVAAYVLSHPRPHFDGTASITFHTLPASYF